MRKEKPQSMRQFAFECEKQADYYHAEYEKALAQGDVKLADEMAGKRSFHAGLGLMACFFMMKKSKKKAA